MISSQKRRQQGHVLFLFLGLWLPIFALSITTLSFLSSGLKRIHEQKRLDSCIYRIQSRRCQILSKISSTNQILRKLLIAAQALQLGHLFSLGSGSAAIRTATAALASTAQFLKTSQDIMSGVEEVFRWQLLSCGLTIPSRNASFRQTSRRRPPRFIGGAMFPSTLEWKNLETNTRTNHFYKLPAYTRILNPLDPYQTFGSCEPTNSATPSLNGEKYRFTFVHPQI